MRSRFNEITVVKNEDGYFKAYEISTGNYIVDEFETDSHGKLKHVDRAMSTNPPVGTVCKMEIIYYYMEIVPDKMVNRVKSLDKNQEWMPGKPVKRVPTLLYNLRMNIKEECGDKPLDTLEDYRKIASEMTDAELVFHATHIFILEKGRLFFTYQANHELTLKDSLI